MRFLIRTLSVFCITVAGNLAHAMAGDVLVVDHQGTADFAEIQGAVDAASPGDTVLVLPGTYNGFAINGKSISIVGDTPQFVRVSQLIRVVNITAEQSVTISNLDFQGGLRMHDSAGHIGVADSRLQTAGLHFDMFSAWRGSHQVLNCEGAVFTRCQLIGRNGGSDPGPCGVLDGADGESGLFVENGRVALYSCDLQGGVGGTASDGSCVFCYQAYEGDGGDGLHVRGNGMVYLDNNTTTGGAHGVYNPSCGFDAQDGLGVRAFPAVTVEFAAAPALIMESETLVRSNDLLDVEIQGPAGSSAWVIWSDSPAWRPLGGAVGLLHLESNSISLIQLGTIPAAGTLVSTLSPPPVSPMMGARRITIQAFAVAPTVGRILGTSTSLNILSPAF